LLSHKKLEDLLLEFDLVNQEQLNTAKTAQRQTGGLLGKTLISLGYITEKKLAEVTAIQFGVPFVDLMAVTVSREVAHLIPYELADRYQIIPIDAKDNELTLAMIDPVNFYALDDVRMITGMNTSPIMASEAAIRWSIDQAYGVKEVIAKAVEQLRPEDAGEITENQTAEDAPVINVVDSLLRQAIKELASDIHIDPQEQGTRVRFRIDGMLKDVITFPSHVHMAIVSRIKIMGGMDISEKRKPQDGRFQVTDKEQKIDIRVASLPTILGEKIVMRILDKQAIRFEIGKLGFSDENLVRYNRLYNQPQGLVLVTGPTGSGKTTTLYSTLMQINSPAKNIITIEEPVEYRLEGVNQVQVNGKAGMTFANGLRAILRQDPNVLMVGEIRDKETADIAVRSALTGHLVFSTMHTNDAAGAVIRLLDMEVPTFLTASSLLGVVAQRLARKLCLNCREAYLLPSETINGQFLCLAGELPVTVYRAKGCPHCGSTGYRGRIAIHEVLTVTSALREAINRRKPEHILLQLAIQEGMQTMRQDGIRKVLSGDTSLEELMRVAYRDV